MGAGEGGRRQQLHQLNQCSGFGPMKQLEAETARLAVGGNPGLAGAAVGKVDAAIQPTLVTLKGKDMN